MKYKSLLYFLSFFNILIFQHFVQAEIESKYNALVSDELINCDSARLESQLEALKTGNEFLKLRFNLMQFQLDKQKELWQVLEEKIDKTALSLQIVENKILMQSKDHLSEVSDIISKQNHLLQSTFRTSSVDDKWLMMAEIKEILKNHHNLFTTFSGKLENVEKILSTASWETHTRELGDSISKNLTILQNIDNKLSSIENVTATKVNQIAFNRNIQNYFNKNEATRICLRDENKQLVCTAQPYPTNCADFNDNYCSNNKCRILNHNYGPDPFLVACDDHTESGGWTVIQRRINGSVDFYRNWSEYKDGFGNINGEFFIGLDKLNALITALQPVELLIQLQDFNDTLKYAKYDEFNVGNEIENYKLKKVGKYSGNAGDSFSQHEGQNFTTKDRNNAEDKNGNCAEYKKGAWWYDNCAWSNLNGMYYNNTKVIPTGSGICWSRFHGYDYSMKFVQMAIRPRRL